MSVIKACLVSIALILGASVAFASDVATETDLKLFGHAVRISGPFNEQKLTVDGKPLVSQALIDIESIEVVGGIGVLIGGASGGGNACDSSPFIISFPSNEPAKVDGPLDECGMGNIKVHQQSIEIEDAPFPDRPGHRYLWTPQGGFMDRGKIAFLSDTTLGWDALRRHDVAFPIDLYKFAAIASAIKDLTGEKETAFTNGLMGPSTGNFEGDIYAGSGCVAHGCPFAGSFIVVDGPKRKIFLAWKEDDKPFDVRPPISDWPRIYRVKLKAWTQEFK